MCWVVNNSAADCSSTVIESGRLYASVYSKLFFSRDTGPLAIPQHRNEPDWMQHIARNAAAGLPSSWRRWTEAAIDQCLAWFQAKRHWWRWLMQTSLCVYSCEWRTFWAFNLAANNAYVVSHILFVNAVNIKQMLLC